jgi:hypothetical protein
MASGHHRGNWHDTNLQVTTVLQQGIAKGNPTADLPFAPYT